MARKKTPSAFHRVVRELRMQATEGTRGDMRARIEDLEGTQIKMVGRNLKLEESIEAIGNAHGRLSAKTTVREALPLKIAIIEASELARDTAWSRKKRDTND